MKLKIVFDLKYQIILSTTDKRTSFILGGICVVFIIFHYLLQVQFLSSFKITKLMIEKASRKIFFHHILRCIEQPPPVYCSLWKILRTPCAQLFSFVHKISNISFVLLSFSIWPSATFLVKYVVFLIYNFRKEDNFSILLVILIFIFLYIKLIQSCELRFKKLFLA